MNLARGKQSPHACSKLGAQFYTGVSLAPHKPEAYGWRFATTKHGGGELVGVARDHRGTWRLVTPRGWRGVSRGDDDVCRDGVTSDAA